MNMLAKMRKRLGVVTLLPFKSAICVTFISGSVCAASYTWSGAAGDNDFNNSLNYNGGDEAGFVIPGSEDTLTIPAEKTITLEYDTTDATKKASCETFAAIGRIIPNTTATFDITVPEGATLDVSAAIVFNTAYTSHSKGRIIKRGAGKLSLNSAGNVLEGKEWYDYFTSMQVEEGILQLPQTSCTRGERFGDVTVCENGVLQLAQASKMDYPAYFYTISGNGTITNSGSAVANFTSWFSSTFDGRIFGRVGVSLRGKLLLTNTNSVYAGTSGQFIVANNKGAGIGSAGVAGIMKFGLNSTETSSTGTNGTIVSGSNGGAFLYLGNGETTAKTLTVKPATSSYPTYLDGGTNGGLVWTGWWTSNKSESTDPDTDYRMTRLVIQGSNTQECVMSGRIIPRNYGGTSSSNVTFCITKQGPGAWRMVYNPDSSMRGVWRILDGNLRFDSIAERGVNSSLGTSSRLYKDIAGVPPLDENKVEHAFWLGGGDGGTRGNLEYVGETNCVSTTRKFAVNGAGAVLNNGVGYLKLSGFYATNTASTLVIGGTNTLDNNFVDDISDGGDATLSVVKEGSGFWAIGTNSTFTGSLDVKGGSCHVGNPLYRFYRWVVKENFWPNNYRDGSLCQYVCFMSLGLFDADGNDRAYGLTDGADGDGDWDMGSYYTGHQYEYPVFGSTTNGDLNMRPGRARVTRYNGGSVSLTHSSDFMTQLFMHTSATGYVWSRDSLVPRQTNQASWVAFTMRPLPGAAITSWDFVNTRVDSTNSKRKYTRVKACDLEASVDGRNWTVLTSLDYPGFDETYYPPDRTWRSDNTTLYDPNQTKHTTGMPIPPGPNGEVSFAASSVSVASGASLTANAPSALSVPKITVNVSDGMGTLKGFALAEGGVIDVVGIDGVQAAEVAVDFSGVTMPATYSLTVNGNTNGRLHASFADGGSKIVVNPVGAILLLR